MVSFVVALNGVDVVELNTGFVLGFSKTARTVGRADSMIMVIVYVLLGLSVMRGRTHRILP